MKHEISEYKRILPQGGLCDMHYYWENLDLEYAEAQRVPSRSSDRDYIIVRTTSGIKKHMYAHGEKLLFDTKEERDAYREAYYAQRAADTHRNTMIRTLVREFETKLKTKSTAELEAYMAKVFK